MIIPAAMDAAMISRVASMTLCRSRVSNSRAQREVAVCAVADALAEPTVQHALAELGLETPSPNQQTSAALGVLQKAEIEKWWPIVKAANIKGE